MFEVLGPDRNSDRTGLEFLKCLCVAMFNNSETNVDAHRKSLANFGVGKAEFEILEFVD